MSDGEVRQVPVRLFAFGVIGLLLAIYWFAPADEPVAAYPASVEHEDAVSVFETIDIESLYLRERAIDSAVAAVVIPTPAPLPTPQAVRREFTPAELDVTLDAEGLPYETQLYDYQISTEVVGDFHAPGGRVRTMDGIGATLDPTWEVEYAPAIVFAPNEILELSVVYSDGANDQKPQWILGVRLDVPGSTVATWGPFEFAYGTDGGMGAIVSQSVINTLTINPLSLDAELISHDTMIAVESYLLGDYDGAEGTDFIVFSNGYGDGGFPMTRGYDEDGELVSVFVLDERRHPWELVVPDGTPPADVTNRRNQLLACLNGERDVLFYEHYSECEHDED